MSVFEWKEIETSMLSYILRVPIVYLIQDSQGITHEFEIVQNAITNLVFEGHKVLMKTITYPYLNKEIHRELKEFKEK